MLFRSENASFMPWLVGTALVHSLAATEKRGVFKSWTVLLAIFTFSLSMLGAFLVRSGVLTSVHSFAVDPERGMFILIFLVIVIGSSLTLYAIKASHIKSTADFRLSSREAMLLVNNLLLVVAAGAVLLGTIYPLFYEAINDGLKISVGPPYFNKVFVPIVVVLFIAMVFSPASRWKQTPRDILIKRQIVPLVSALVIVSLSTAIFASSFELLLVFIDTIALWIILSLMRDVFAKVANKKSKLKGLFTQTMSYYGMLMGHFGIAITIIGVTTTVYFTQEKDVRMVPGDELTLSSYHFKLTKMVQVKGPNYVADQAEIEVREDGKLISILRPEKRFYAIARNTMTEADIDVGLFRDIFVALGEPLDNGAWAVRIHYKPFVRWIWFGGMFIALGGFLTILDKRYRSKKVRVAAIANVVGVPA